MSYNKHCSVRNFLFYDCYLVHNTYPVQLFIFLGTNNNDNNNYNDFYSLFKKFFIYLRKREQAQAVAEERRKMEKQTPC